jgi:cytosine/uracil/thiamine/allantoin permease
LLLVVAPFFAHVFTLFGLCVALATASLYGNTMPDPVVATTMLVTALVEDAFFFLFFGGPLK